MGKDLLTLGCDPFICLRLQNNGRVLPLGCDKCEVSHKGTVVRYNHGRNGEFALRNDIADYHRRKKLPP